VSSPHSFIHSFIHPISSIQYEHPSTLGPCDLASPSLPTREYQKEGLIARTYPLGHLPTNAFPFILNSVTTYIHPRDYQSISIHPPIFIPPPHAALPSQIQSSPSAPIVPVTNHLQAKMASLSCNPILAPLRPRTSDDACTRQAFERQAVAIGWDNVVKAGGQGRALHGRFLERR
jgi:hypothetical protein